MDYKHTSVLLDESIEGLNIKADGIYVDATLGGGGHTEEILRRVTGGRVIGIDQDDYAIERATEKLKNYKNFTAVKNNFSNIEEVLDDLNIEKVDGILFDLGVSSFQLDIPERGFSYNNDMPLDMRQLLQDILLMDMKSMSCQEFSGNTVKKSGLLELPSSLFKRENKNL